MARVRVVTDSACDLSAAVTEQQGITMVPLSIRFGTEEVTNSNALSVDDFWARCAASPVLPETSAPSPGAFQDAFLAAADDGYDGVVCINISGELSGTNQSARAAAEAVADRIRVLTVDSRSATMGQGLIVLDVAELAASGATPEELVAQAESVIPRTSVFGAVNSLEHLEKGGRIGGAKAMLGTLLSIKPVITVVNGIVEEESKQRTRSRSLRYLADKAQAAGPLSRIAVCNGAATDIDELLGLLDGVKSEHPLMVADLGPVIGTHTGPGTVGLCMITTG